MRELEGKLLACGVLERAKIGDEDGGRRVVRKEEEEVDEDDDWD